MATLMKSWQVWGGREEFPSEKNNPAPSLRSPRSSSVTLKSLTASVWRACEGSVVRGDVRASLLKQSVGCLHVWQSEREPERRGGHKSVSLSPPTGGRLRSKSPVIPHSRLTPQRQRLFQAPRYRLQVVLDVKIKKCTDFHCWWEKHKFYSASQVKLPCCGCFTSGLKCMMGGIAGVSGH